MDLIDKEQALGCFWNYGYTDGTGYDETEMPAYYRLQALPIVVEGEIIRCKDCEHYKFADNRAFGFPVKHCEVTGFEDVEDNDFCSRAERKEDAFNSRNKTC